MINKALRIMIADPQHLRRLRIERHFNHQGYYAIAPVASLDEMLILLGYGNTVFDLVLINDCLAGDESIDLSALCLDHPWIRQTFIYAMPQRHSAVLESERAGRLMFSSVQLPEGVFIKQVMHKVDPPSRHRELIPR